jgi:hypothetical protein
MFNPTLCQKGHAMDRLQRSVGRKTRHSWQPLRCQCHRHADWGVPQKTEHKGVRVGVQQPQTQPNKVEAGRVVALCSWSLVVRW